VHALAERLQVAITGEVQEPVEALMRTSHTPADG
jgi:hypothetical protein